MTYTFNILTTFTDTDNTGTPLVAKHILHTTHCKLQKKRSHGTLPEKWQHT